MLPKTEQSQALEELRALSWHLQAAREAERHRIARELHDELGQALTGLRLGLGWLHDRLPVDQPVLLERARSMLQLVDSTIQAVRRIATELRPSVLDHLGLKAALEWQAREFTQRTGIACMFQADFEEIPVNAEQAAAVFRIVQEALTNVARHAQATQADIRLRAQGSDVILEVADNGKGMAQCAQAHSGSLGLLGMRERALAFGGEVQIRTASSGTTVAVRIPRAKRHRTQTAR